MVSTRITSKEAEVEGRKVWNSQSFGREGENIEEDERGQGRKLSGRGRLCKEMPISFCHRHTLSNRVITSHTKQLECQYFN